MNLRVAAPFAVVLAVSAVAGCQGASGDKPVPTVTATVTAEPVAAKVPAECEKALAELEALLQQATTTGDAWQAYATGPMVQLLQGATSPDSVVAAHDAAVQKQTDLAEQLKASDYAALKAACLG